MKSLEERIEEILEETWGETNRVAYKEAIVRLLDLINQERKQERERIREAIDRVKMGEFDGMSTVPAIVKLRNRIKYELEDKE